jgi:3-methylcrotonyl-CoA carboxylase alpha subunit/acetyl-CoA/propionyl-CoA carboxylase biotin carboxyl carrier protein
MSFGSLLVANRGEIAVRVLRAARAAGLRTVAVYSDADRGAPHARAADSAVRIGPTPAAQSYLSIDALVDAARRADAEAVHPGYGFLSERAEFARACVEAGLVFVGPPADVIEVMGRKDAAREVARRADVPVVPAVSDAGFGSDDELVHRAADEVGFPLLAKAAAGGGGKGMRVVRDPAELPAALAAARREAAAAFGDDAMLLERYVERGRHVEVQVLADAHGHVVHLFERDCSVQRRHQKVLEEAPAPTITEAVRERLTSAAVRLAAEVGYVNAGTVEFLVAGEGDAAEVFFLEMNTRLQVEHRVTELVTGLDLVALQLLVAQGRPLPFTQADLTLEGHAIEARVYAEDAYAGFLPQAGRASTVHWSDRCRVDAALESGQVVSTAYDPMLGKVIARGATREGASQALVAALDDTAILGLTTNLGFLRDLAASDEFRDAAIHTAWLDQQGGLAPPATPDAAWAVAAWALTAGAASPEAGDPFGTADGFRLAGPPAGVPVELVHTGAQRLLVVKPGTGEVSCDGRTWTLRLLAHDGGRLRLEIDGVVHEAQVEVGPHAVAVAHHGHTFRFERPDLFAGRGAAALGDGQVTAPMPGTVVSVDVTPGTPVQAGQSLGVLEAMKMELSLKAPFDGVVERVAAEPGAQVALGQTLFVVTVEES